MDKSNNKFEIENGVLIGYTGDDKEVVIPSGVVSIGDMVFFGSKNLHKSKNSKSKSGL